MKSKTFKILILLFVMVIGFLVYVYHGLTNIDFIGTKDPKTVKENQERWNKMLLKAKTRNGTDHCEISILDSVNIEINIGNRYGGKKVSKTYSIKNDTIHLENGNKEIEDYINSNYFIIQDSLILYKLLGNGEFDTQNTMAIKFNKFKK